MSRFNLIDEKWIPIRYPGGTRDELGIRDVLLRSRDITGIEDPSPLVVAALHRFLFAVLYRALEGPTDIEQAKLLFKEGLPGEKISAYLEKWRDRFWLFDEGHPFGQIPTFDPKIWRAWTVLATEHNADNAKVLFDHVNVSNPGTVSEASAIRWMLATQTFSVSCGKSELSHTGTAPSATSAMALPIGRDFQDTLLFALTPQNREIIGIDRPLWERTPETVGILKEGFERNATGLSDWYTWRTRSVRLKADDTGLIGKLAFASGIGCISTDQTDPMLAYRIDEKRGKLPIQFRERGIWRDFDSLLPDEAHLAPQVIEHATLLTRTNRERFPQSVIVLGQANDKAKIKYWRMERFILPKALSGDHFIRAEIRQLLSDVEAAQSSLWEACKAYARNVLSRGNRKVSKEDINKFVKQMPTSEMYWSFMESHFHEVLHEYTLDYDPDEIRCKWLKDIRNALQSTWDNHHATVSAGDSWAIRAFVKAEAPIRLKLNELNKEINKLESQKEEI